MKKDISIELKLTDRCNQRCFHCVNRDSLKRGNDVNWELFNWKLKEWDNNKNRSLYNIKEVRMTGGEPFLCLSLMQKIATTCRSLGIKSGVNTNGTLLNSSNAQMLKDTGLNTVKISFDAYDMDTYRKIRGNCSSPEQVLKAIKIAVKKEFNVILRFTLSLYNITHLLECYQIACDEGVKIFQIKPLIRVGRAINSNTFLSTAEINSVLAELEAQLTPETPVPQILCWPHRKASKLKYKICGSINKLYFSPKLEATICNYVQPSRQIGNMSQVSLEYILHRRSDDVGISSEGFPVIKGCPNLTYFNAP